MGEPEQYFVASDGFAHTRNGKTVRQYKGGAGGNHRPPARFTEAPSRYRHEAAFFRQASVAGASAQSGDLFGNDEMGFMGAAVGVGDTVGELVRW